MPKIGGAFAVIDTMPDTARLAVSTSGSSVLTRDEWKEGAEVDKIANKAVATAFVAQVRRQCGDRAADMVQTRMGVDMTGASPITAGMIKRIMREVPEHDGPTGTGATTGMGMGTGRPTGMTGMTAGGGGGGATGAMMWTGRPMGAMAGGGGGGGATGATIKKEIIATAEFSVRDQVLMGKNNFSEDDVRVFRSMGVSVERAVTLVPDEMEQTMMRMDNLSVRDFILLKHKSLTAEQVEEHRNAGLTVPQAIDAIALSLSPTQAKALLATGFTLEDARNGITPEAGRAFLDRGYSMEDTRYALRNGVSIERAIEYGNADFTVHDAAILARIGTSVETAQQFRARGFGVGDTAVLRHGGITLEQAIPFKNQKFSAAETALAVRNNVTLDQAIRFRTAEFSMADTAAAVSGGITLEQALPFRGGPITMPEIVEATRNGVPLDFAQSFRRENFSIAEATTAHRGGLPLDQAMSFRTNGISVSEAIVARRYGITAEQARPFSDREFTMREAGVAIRAGLTGEQVMAHHDAQIPIHERTIIRSYADGNVDPDFEPVLLTDGMLNAPLHLRYLTDSGSSLHGVYKKVDGDRGLGISGLILGIPRGHAQLAVRNVATKAVADQLGFNVIPRTEIGSYGGELGVVLEFSPGLAGDHLAPVTLTGAEAAEADLIYNEPGTGPDRLAALKISRHDTPAGFVYRTTVPCYGAAHDYTEPDLRKALMKLQLVDLLTSQADRHHGNYMVERHDDGRFRALHGIDNDQSFGTRFTDLRNLRQQVPVEAPVLNLPDVIDTEMRTALMPPAMTADLLRAQLDGLLPGPEIDAAVGRLASIQNHITTVLDPGGRVIGPDEWGGPVASLHLRDPETSYVGREVARLAKFTRDTLEGRA